MNQWCSQFQCQPQLVQGTAHFLLKPVLSLISLSNVGPNLFDGIRYTLIWQSFFKAPNQGQGYQFRSTLLINESIEWGSRKNYCLLYNGPPWLLEDSSKAGLNIEIDALENNDGHTAGYHRMGRKHMTEKGRRDKAEPNKGNGEINIRQWKAI